MKTRTFVILAAGAGQRMGRVGDSLHKALAPIDGRAIISHLVDLAPLSCKIVICVGNREDQIMEYMALAHPQLQVQYVHIKDWDEPGNGPGASLYDARGHVEGDLIFAPCDTLWKNDHTLWTTETSWMGVAPIPSGTDQRRWCRVVTDVRNDVYGVYDKNDRAFANAAYTGLAYIKEEDQAKFWNGIMMRNLIDDERQVSGGFNHMLALEIPLQARHIIWTDVGDEAAYRLAVAKMTGYDWTKPDEATYVIPQTGRVVKFFADDTKVSMRVHRGHLLGDAVPQPIMTHKLMFSYPFIPGVSAYDRMETSIMGGGEPLFVTERILDFRRNMLMMKATVPDPVIRKAMQGVTFYHDKTYARIAMLSDDAMRRTAFDAVSKVDWQHLIDNIEPAIIHGDFTYGNLVITADDHIVCIDWREDFGGEVWGDARYDLGKLLTGCYVHLDRARHGDFRPWPEGELHASVIRNDPSYTRDVDIIGALCLINSSPLHATPLDDIFVSRGVAWLEEYV
jgi:molybdopterin-guanine dinucleotide biosynthesis protein A